MSNYVDKDWLHSEYITKNKTLRQLTNEFGYTSVILCKFLKEYKIKKPTKYSNVTREHLYHEYITNNKTLKQICKEFNYKETTICRLFRKFKITKPDKIPEKLTEEYLYNQYILQDKNIKEIAFEIPCSLQLVTKFIHNTKIDNLNLIEYKILQQEKQAKEILDKEYSLNNKPITQISKETSIPTNFLRNIKKKFNIPDNERVNAPDFNDSYREIMKNYGNDFLYHFAIENKMTIKEISEKIDIKESTVFSWVRKQKRNGISILRLMRDILRIRYNEEFLYKEYVTNSKSPTQIAQENNDSQANIYYWIARYKIPSRSNKKTLSKKLTKEFLNLRYIFEEKSIEEIGEEVKCHPSIVRKYLNKFGFPKIRKPFIFEGDITYCQWNSIKQGAKNRNLEFNITIEYIWNLFIKQNRKCVFSGLTLITGKKEYFTNTASLDRIDSKIGYIEGNVQYIHRDLNIMKQAMSDEKFMEWVKIIYEFKKLNEK